MSIDEFLVKLAETPRTWTLVDDEGPFGGVMRLGSCCPVTAVHHERANCSALRRCGGDLGLTQDDVFAIAHAADGDAGHDKGLRARLLAACGLSEAS